MATAQPFGREVRLWMVAMTRTAGGLLVVLALLIPTRASASERRLAMAEAVAVPASSPIVLDGKFTEEIWQRATPVGDFLQREPAEGEPPTMRTEARVAYDASNTIRPKT